MKVFAISVLLLCVMLLGIVWNCIYIDEVTSTMDRLLDRLPSIGEENCVREIEAMREYWNSRADTIGLTVAFPIVDRINEQTEALLTCAQVGDVYGFAVARALLRDAIEDARRLERFSIANLL